jgi:hypothetical protein
MLVGTMAARKTKASKTRKSAAAKARPKVRAKKARAKRTAAKAPKKKLLRAKAPAKRTKAPRAKARAPKKATRPTTARAAKKPSAPKKATAPRKAITPKPAVRRRDGAGHLDPKYAATLREKSLEGHVEDRDKAFVGSHTKDDLAEEMGETWVETATTGEDTSQAVYNQDVPEDEGGPFVTTTAGQEFAEGTDASNPSTAKREPFPRT